MYIITSKKKGIRAISDKNNSVDFHNKLFATDDCVVTVQKDPTEAEVAAMREQEALGMKEPVDEITVLKLQIAALTNKASTIETRVATVEGKKFDKELSPLVVDIAKLKTQMTDVSDAVGWLQSKTVVVENKITAIEEEKIKEEVVKADLKVKEP